MAEAHLPQSVVGEVAGEGPDLVWGHGLNGCRAGDDEFDLFGISSIAGLRVTRYDAPGHGEAPPVSDDETTRWDHLGPLMLEVASSVGAERFVAAGASMGTATSLWAAVTAPSRIAAMVLVIPPTAWETRQERAEFYLAGVRLLESEGIGAYLDAADALPLNPSLGALAPAMRAASRARLERADPVSLAHVLRGAAASNFPAREAVAALRMPVLICAWEGDPTHPASTAEELAALLPNAELERAGSLEAIRAWRTTAAAWLSELGLRALS